MGRVPVIDCDERPGHRLLGARSEHHWLRLCHGRLGHLFPYLPGQPGYHKRLKAAGPLLAAVIDHLARQSPSSRPRASPRTRTARQEVA